jgi:hypothetical protein
MSVTNYICPYPGRTVCSGPLEYLPVSFAVPAYTNPVVYQDATYDYGGELDSPGFRSDMVFIGIMDRDLNGTWLVMSMRNGQLMTGATGVFSLSRDVTGNIVSTTLTVGVPGYVRLRYYDGIYVTDASNINVGVTTQ